MGKISAALGPLIGRPMAEQQRAVSYQDVWGTGGNVDILGGNQMALVPLFAAVRLITDQFASTPLHAYRATGGPAAAPERIDDPPLLTPVHGSRPTWKTECISGLLTLGNAVGLHTSYDRYGWPAGTVWVNPNDVQCNDDEPGAPVYFYLGRRLNPGTFVHIPWLTLPGRAWGLSPLGMFKLLWETGAAAQNLARNFYDSGGVPSGHLKNSARELLPAQADDAKQKFRRAVQGRDVLVTGNDWEYNAIGLPADQLAFVAALRMTATQIASIYGIAPEDIGGEAAAGLQYSTVEMNEIKLSTRTMRPWYTRVEQALSDHIPRGQYLSFNADELVRADLASRMAAHEIATRVGVEDQDEARRREQKQPMTPEQFARWQATYRPVQQASGESREAD